MPRHRDSDQLRPRDRVIAVRPVGTIPEGSTGVIKLIVGQAWTRYWVAFDSGEWVNGVDSGQIVRSDRYDAWKAEQAEAAVRAATAVADTPAAPDAAPAASEGSSSGIPAHLLERSRQARARKEAAAAAAG